jgi:N-methylhydantoinase A
MSTVIRAATDVGGTFTDLVYYSVDEATGKTSAVHTAKVDTTPPDFEQGVMASLRKGGIDARQMAFFAHGSTVVINAITERKGAKVGLITTKGFRDVLEIARGNRPDLFNFNFRKPAPFVERHLRAEVAERTNYKGEIEAAAALDAVPGILADFRAEGVTAIAVCFLHSYLNPANEVAVTREIRRLWPEVSVISSHELSREWREYERTSTAVLSAYVHPVLKRYIESLERELRGVGFAYTPYMMLSNGGIATVESAKSDPIAMVESGPASGIFAAAHLGRKLGQGNLIVLDIGGTTAKCALVDDGNVKIVSEYHVEKTRRTPGYPIQTAVCEIVEIGNGGGSIAWVDAGGKLHVGPQSAGASPGPVAYGRGGREVTTTDANLFLGRIDPDSFAGGAIRPDWQAVTAGFETLGKELGVSAQEAARGVVRIANANMTNALRLISTNRGHDPREYALMAFGGGGPMHVLALAEELKVPKVIVPVNSAVFSAWGMLLTDLRRDLIQTQLLALDASNRERIAAQIRTLESEAADSFRRDGARLDGPGLVCEYMLDLRYQGQEHTVKVPIAAGAGGVDIQAIADGFHAAHEKRFTYRLAAAIQIVNFHLIARIPVAKPELPKRQMQGLKLADAVKSRRRVDFDAHGVHEALIYDGERLEHGMRFSGPAIVQEPMVTLVVPPGAEVTLDEYGSYHVALNPR